MDHRQSAGNHSLAGQESISSNLSGNNPEKFPKEFSDNPESVECEISSDPVDDIPESFDSRPADSPESQPEEISADSDTRQTPASGQIEADLSDGEDAVQKQDFGKDSVNENGDPDGMKPEQIDQKISQLNEAIARQIAGLKNAEQKISDAYQNSADRKAGKSGEPAAECKAQTEAEPDMTVHSDTAFAADHSGKAAYDIHEKPEAASPQKKAMKQGAAFEEEMEQLVLPIRPENEQTDQNASLSMAGTLEGLLFASGDEGLSLIQLQSVFPSFSRTELTERLEALQKKMNSKDSGIEVVCYASRWKLCAKETVYPLACKLYAAVKAPALSSAAMEVLALVAYRQPITRVEIEDIRGVSSDVMLKKLQARGLIETCGRKDAAGKPLLYRVTDGFLDAFGLESIEDLPAVGIDAVDGLQQGGTLFTESEEIS